MLIYVSSEYEVLNFLFLIEIRTVENKEMPKYEALVARVSSADREIEGLQKEIYRLRRSISRHEMGSSRACDTNKTELTSDCQVDDSLRC